MLMALHYKALCKSYKKQLVDSHKKISELTYKIEQLEQQSNRSNRKQKASLDLIKFETDENMRLTIEKCGAYCKKINEFIEFKDDHQVAENATSTAVSTTNLKLDEEGYSEEMIIKTLQSIVRERREIRVIALFIYF